MMTQFSSFQDAAQFASGGVEVDLDKTFLVQSALFVVLMFILKPLLFDPMLRLFEEREKRIDGARHAARSIDTESAGAEEKYQREMGKARVLANQERDQLRAEGVKEEQAILAKVRKETQASVDEGRRKAREEAELVRQTLRADTATLAKDIASRMLGREVSS